MKLAIMQPYLFPYIGYFQLMNLVDQFVLYDDIEYTKKGWINRNRILSNGKDGFITIPLKKGSDFLPIKDRYLSATWEADRIKILNKIKESYRKAPYFASVFPMIQSIMLTEERQLFRFILNSLNVVREYLGIGTSFVISSTLFIDQQLKAEKKVIAICKVLNASTYINPIGGTSLYNTHEFKAAALDLRFLQSTNVQYKQFTENFVPALSIIDVLMFNDKNTITTFLNTNFTLL